MYYLKTLKRKNSRKFDKIVFQTESEQEMKDFLLSNGLNAYSKPYVFTYIELPNNHIITQTHTPSGLICSPEKLFNFLTK